VSHPGALGSICYEQESTFGEDVDTATTHRVATIGPVDTSGLSHAKVDSMRTVQYRNAGTQWIRMADSGSFKTDIYLAGHGSTTAGSPTADAYETLLGFVFGNAALSASASTTLTGGTASVPTTTASGTFSAGGVAFIGAAGDGRGNGQMYGITTHVTTTLTLLNALAASPTNGDVLYPAMQLYPSESPTTTSITGLRFLINTANLAYMCHGCFPMSYSISGTGFGEVPRISVTWGVSWFETSTATFPSTVASSNANYNPSPINSTGLLHVQDVGTVTRNARTHRNFALDVQIGIEPTMGPGGANAYQTIMGARRTVDKYKVSWTEDADAKTLTPVLEGYGTGTTSKVVAWTGSTAIGSRVGCLLRSVCISNIPVQRIDQNLNRLLIEGYGYTGATTTNDLTLSSFVWGMA
jgi:hypothetical protein